MKRVREKWMEEESCGVYKEILNKKSPFEIESINDREEEECDCLTETHAFHL